MLASQKHLQLYYFVIICIAEILRNYIADTAKNLITHYILITMINR